MEGLISTVVICLLVAGAVFLAARKLWRDKKAGKTCCGGGCSCCCGCEKTEKRERAR